MFKKNLSGFTLVELLVVIGVASVLLFSTVVGGMQVARRMRDTKRLADMQEIRIALDQYYKDHGQYPEEPSPDPYNCAGWDTSYDGSFMQTLINEGYLDKTYNDPLNPKNPSNFDKANHNCDAHTAGNPGYNYFYYRYTVPGYSGLGKCPSSVVGEYGMYGSYYVLGIGNLETVTSGHHPSSPGWTCPDRDWHSTLEWVVGGYDGKP
jgi:prepilin-type N-terminal cleavage/methylation domain-containing protein